MIPLPKSLKRQIKGWLKKKRMIFIRRFYGFDANELSKTVKKLGLQKGSVVLVHSSWDRFSGFSGKPTDLINTLSETIGVEGTLIMPTLPFSGSALEWAESKKIFDVMKTPSKMGLISEYFRRLPGVIRSVHPTHSVASLGPLSISLCKDHFLSTSPCGQHSPYARLLENKGVILFLGTSIESMTFFHTMEEVLETNMRVSPFTQDYYTLTSKTLSGSLVSTKTRLFNPDLSRKRRISKLIPLLKSRKQWQECRLGTVTMILLHTDSIANAMQTMAEKGEYCYDQ